ncbi:sensor histidine kinase [Geovibrio thiophilus]|uniref:histidine kinase n=1 Tax=Geovibrio thiophilus TaxID=139438 RepID=A0A3R5XZ92_9BACT|nr:HAMP domain-containing sensor histidine kinase [Geovibrio thiophilus]QAR34356.1 sensor histidine kinase [Geovibrio thiophilus]
MSIRLKISILIASAGLLSALVFSASVLFEMLEQPFRVMDTELRTVAFESVAALDQAGVAGVRDNRRYWIKIYKRGEPEPLYVSHIAQKIDLPESNGRKSLAHAYVPDELSYVEHDSHGKTAFRIRRFVIEKEHTGVFEEDDDDGNYDDDELKYIVYAALSAERVSDEIADLMLSVAAGLLLSVVVLTAVSYMIAGYILRPVRLMNARTRSITERHLNLRIPLKEKAGASDEFNTLAMTLNGVFDRLENAFNKQKRLIADASHELKTPLSIMRLITDEVNMSGSISADDARRLSEQVLRMERLVKNILNLSTLELDSGISAEAVELRSMLEALKEDYSLLASERGISIVSEFTGVLTVGGDFDKLFRAFSNILDNAVKYTSDGGIIRITGFRTDETVKIKIFNTGAGIPAASIGRVFEQFYRVEESRASRYGGSGLGLAIVKRIIELHKGEINIESVQGESATVTVILPSS